MAELSSVANIVERAFYSHLVSKCVEAGLRVYFHNRNFPIEYEYDNNGRPAYLLYISPAICNSPTATVMVIKEITVHIHIPDTAVRRRTNEHIQLGDPKLFAKMSALLNDAYGTSIEL